MPIIDSHVHIWTNDRAFPWATDTADPPQFDAHPQALLKLMQSECIERAVLVQYIGYRWDNTYVAQMLRAFPEKFMGVCRVDPQDPSAPERLCYWTEMHGFRGVRLSPEPDSRGDWFRGPLMLPLFRQAAQLNIPVLILTKPSRLPDLINILEKVPDVDVVIDHMADCAEDNPLHSRSLLTLARYPRVFLKTGHVWSNSALDYPWKDQYAVIQRVCEMFGPERIMWGSDWPFCLRHATYTQALSFVRDEMHFLSREDLAWLLGETALRLWPFFRTDEREKIENQRREGDAPIV